MQTEVDFLKSLLIEIASKKTHVREEGGQNIGSEIVELQQATWLAPGSWPWCAAFTCWVLREWLEDNNVRKALSALTGKNISETSAEKYRCKDPSAFGWEKWAKKLNLQVIYDDRALAKRGDFVVYEFSHIGIVVDDQGDNSNHIKTIEGNTSEAGGREGDGVYLKTRSCDLVKCYIRFFR